LGAIGIVLVFSLLLSDAATSYYAAVKNEDTPNALDQRHIITESPMTVSDAMRAEADTLQKLTVAASQQCATCNARWRSEP